MASKNSQREFDIVDITKAFAMLSSTDTLKRFAHVIDPATFEQPELRWVSMTAKEVFAENKKAPTTEVYEARLRSDKRLKADEKEIIAEFIQEMAVAMPRKQSFPEFRRILENFIQTAYIDAAVGEVAELVREGELQEVGELLRTLSLPIQASVDAIFAPRDIGMLWREDFLESVVPTGIRKLDELMSGGLRATELGVFMAPTGYGKSMALVHVAAAAWRRGLNIVHFSFENSPEETLRRYVSNMADAPIEMILEGGEHGKIVQRLKRMEDSKGSEIAIIRRTGSGTTVNDLLSDFIAVEEVYDFEPDLMIVDYGDLMRPSVYGKDNYENMKVVFEELHDLAIESNVPVWTATQSNRESLKAKRTKLEHISDSLGKAMNADIVIGLSRPEKDTALEEGSDDVTGDVGELKILKFRRGIEGDIVHVQTDFARARFIELDVDEEDIDARGEAIKTRYSKDK